MGDPDINSHYLSPGQRENTVGVGTRPNLAQQVQVSTRVHFESYKDVTTYPIVGLPKPLCILEYSAVFRDTCACL